MFAERDDVDFDLSRKSKSLRQVAGHGLDSAEYAGFIEWIRRPEPRVPASRSLCLPARSGRMSRRARLRPVIAPPCVTPGRCVVMKHARPPPLKWKHHPGAQQVSTCPAGVEQGETNDIGWNGIKDVASESIAVTGANLGKFRLTCARLVCRLAGGACSVGLCRLGRDARVRRLEGVTGKVTFRGRQGRSS